MRGHVLALAAGPAASDEQVNANWHVGCKTDSVTNIRTCRAHSPSHDGFAGAITVFFEGKRGPYINISGHSTPGRRPLIRFDNDTNPRTIHDDAGVTPHMPQISLANRMKAANIAHIRYYDFGYGARTTSSSVAGFGAAWRRLQIYMDQ